jgi:hypothetical protein
MVIAEGKGGEKKRKDSIKARQQGYFSLKTNLLAAVDSTMLRQPTPLLFRFLLN